MGEYADEAIERAMRQMEAIVSPRQQAKRERIRQAGLKENRQIMASIAKQEYCLDLLPDLDDEDDNATTDGNRTD